MGHSTFGGGVSPEPACLLEIGVGAFKEGDLFCNTSFLLFANEKCSVALVKLLPKRKLDREDLRADPRPTAERAPAQEADIVLPGLPVNQPSLPRIVEPGKLVKSIATIPERERRCRSAPACIPHSASVGSRATRPSGSWGSSGSCYDLGLTELIRGHRSVSSSTGSASTDPPFRGQPMTQSHESELYALFRRACQMSPDERARYLDELEAKDPALGTELRVLLSADDREGAVPKDEQATLFSSGCFERRDFRRMCRSSACRTLRSYRRASVPTGSSLFSVRAEWALSTKPKERTRDEP